MSDPFDFDSLNVRDVDPSFLEDVLPDPEELARQQEEAEENARIDPSFIDKPKRSPIATKYQKKANTILGGATLATAQLPATVADSAALFLYGPKVAEKLGDLAAVDPKVRRGLDMISDGVENPYISVVQFTIPLVIQLLRNHEPVLEPTQRGIRIPFTKGKRILRFRFGIKLGLLRNNTIDPDVLTDYVYTNPEVKAKLAENGVKIASRRNRRRFRTA